MAAIKTEREIALIAKACNITDGVFSRIISNFSFRTENELADFIKQEAKKAGCKLSFRTIIAAAGNAAQPHHKPRNTHLKGFVVIDMGVIYKGYMSDMTRTIYVGKPSSREIAVYNLLKKSQETPIRKIRPGMKCSEAHWIASRILGRWDNFFIHGLGHGVGTRIHERPRIRKKSRFYLRENMAITVEPGIYVKKKFGMRIEDTCVIRKNRCIPLTKSTKKLLVFSAC